MLTGVLFLIGLGVVAAEAPPADRPNIIVILSDDMGYSDLGCYGGEIQTRTLDRLAENGLRYSQFYNTARCCPTRACLLTGLYPHQAGIGHMTKDLGTPAYQGELNRQCATLAEVLSSSGYASYAVGKWHVCRDVAVSGPKDHWPRQRGFDRYYGIVSGAANFFDPFTLCRENERISAFADPEYQPTTYYLTDAISDHAVRFLEDHQQQSPTKPFFLYMAYTAAHWPMHALPEDIAKYKGVYKDGYEPIRQARFERCCQLGLIDPSQGLAPQAWDWSEIKNKKREVACMQVYAAMIDRMDQGIGRVVAHLESHGLLDNTIVLFMQDNGGCAEGMGRAKAKGRFDGPRAEKPLFPPIAKDAVANKMIGIQTREGYPVRQGPNVMPGPADTYIAYGEGWANVSNTPFREYKHWVHEGGISTPLIVHWPAGIAARGELRRQPSHLIDIAPTLYEIAGASYPKDVQSLVGKSLVPTFQDQPIEREAIYWEHEGNRAVRAGDWKLVSKHGEPWELHDLSTDRVEARDLSAKNPDRVRELSSLWEKWAKDVGVVEWPIEPK